MVNKPSKIRPYTRAGGMEFFLGKASFGWPLVGNEGGFSHNFIPSKGVASHGIKRHPQKR